MDKDKVKAFADKVYADMVGTMSVGMAYVGVKTGLFRAMAGLGAANVDTIVDATSLQRRYVEEWLKGMTAAGYITYDGATGTYLLPQEHGHLLASEGTDHFMGGLFHFAPVLLRVAPKVAEAFRVGGGVKFAEFGTEGVEALDMINAGQYEQRFTTYWLAKIPDVAKRLGAGGRVLDIGCGVGRVATAIAKAYPDCDVIGLDPDVETIRQAEHVADGAGRSGRLRFVAKTTAEMERGAGFDLITACDCVHDFSAPERTLEEIRGLLKPEGALFIVEPKASDDLEGNINPIAAMYYGFSLFHCMTQSLAEGGPGLGTCMGPKRTSELLREAGFASVQLLDIRSQTNLFYVARP